MPLLKFPKVHKGSQVLLVRLLPLLAKDEMLVQLADDGAVFTELPKVQQRRYG